MGSPSGTMSRRSIDRGVKKVANITVEWYNRDGLTPSQIEQVDRYVFGAMKYYTQMLRNDNYRTCLFCLNEGKILSAKPDMPIGMSLIYVKDANESGAGSAGTRGFTLYAGAVNLHYNQGGESTPPYAAIHELHHVYGSHTEFDAGSQAAYEGFVMANCINEPQYSKLRTSLAIGARTLLEYSQKDQKWYMERFLEHVFLHKQYPSKYINVLKDQGFTTSSIRTLVDILE